MFIFHNIRLLPSDITKIMKKISLEEIIYDVSPYVGYGNTLKNSTALVELKYTNHSGKYVKVGYGLCFSFMDLSWKLLRSFV